MIEIKEQFLRPTDTNLGEYEELILKRLQTKPREKFKVHQRKPISLQSIKIAWHV